MFTFFHSNHYVYSDTASTKSILKKADTKISIVDLALKQLKADNLVFIYSARKVKYIGLPKSLKIRATEEDF